MCFSSIDACYHYVYIFWGNRFIAEAHILDRITAGPGKYVMFLLHFRLVPWLFVFQAIRCVWNNELCPSSGAPDTKWCFSHQDRRGYPPKSPQWVVSVAGHCLFVIYVVRPLCYSNNSPWHEKSCRFQQVYKDFLRRWDGHLPHWVAKLLISFDCITSAHEQYWTAGVLEAAPVI